MPPFFGGGASGDDAPGEASKFTKYLLGDGGGGGGGGGAPPSFGAASRGVADDESPAAAAAPTSPPTAAAGLECPCFFALNVFFLTFPRSLTNESMFLSSSTDRGATRRIMSLKLLSSRPSGRLSLRSMMYRPPPFLLARSLAKVVLPLPARPCRR